MADHGLPGHGAAHPGGERVPGLAGLRHRQAQGEAGERGHRARHVDGHEVRDGEVGGELLHRGDHLVPHDRVLRAVVLELLAQLAGGVQRVVLDDDGAEPEHGVERDDVLGAVRQHDGDRIPRLDPERRKAGGRAIDRLLQVAVRRRAAEELQGRRVRVVVCRRLDDVDEGSGDLREVLRHPLGVAGGPGTGRNERRHVLSLCRVADRTGTPPRVAPTAPPGDAVIAVAARFRTAFARARSGRSRRRPARRRSPRRWAPGSAARRCR
ncbi:hypothetical protein RL72_01322 [Microbacterium azadirachtae]|uniref:Uncharacterized protein n=1 Tax=Microbacterium azadirachtae TaxID=582680 RepID=A0A0F0KZJ6_9MICO|nr:hypothetical protein RL72_01322 [Microbacterium azadirachtae]